MLREKILKELRPIRSWCGGVEEELLKRGEKPEFPISFLPKLNSKVWGLRKGLNLIGARTSNCKSTWVRQLAWTMAKEGLTVFFMSLEDDVTGIIENLFVLDKQINNYDLQIGAYKCSQEYQQKWKEFVADMPKNLIISNNIGSTFDEVNYLLEAMQPTPRVVIVDYLQAIKIEGKEREVLDEYIRKFREICMNKNICGILVSQMNRESVKDGGEPELIHFKGSGKQEEHADLAAILSWGFKKDNNELNINDFTITIGKNKKGRTGVHKVMYYPETYRFEERMDA